MDAIKKTRIVQFVHDSLIFLGLVMALGILLVTMGWYQFVWQKVGGSGTYMANIEVLEETNDFKQLSNPRGK